MAIPNDKSSTNQSQAIREESKQMADEARSKARETREQLTAGWEQARKRVREDASSALSGLQSQAQDAIRGRKTEAARYTRDAAAAVHEAADQLREHEDHALAGYVNGFADQIDRVSDYIDHRDIDEIADDTRNIARQHPAMFFGGLFVAGLALGRMLRASENHHPFDLKRGQQEYESSPGSSSSSSSSPIGAGYTSPSMFPESSIAGSPSRPPAVPGSIETGPRMGGPNRPQSTGEFERPQRPDAPGRGPDHLA